VSFDDSIESIAVGEGHLWVTTAPLGMDMPDDTVSTLHRIDPVTLEETADPIEVAEPGSQLEVAYGYVWVGDPNNKQIVQIDPYGNDSPAPTATPETTPDDEVVTDEDCATFLPFLSTDADARLGLGSGGQADVPLAEQSPSALVHWAFEQGRYIDFVAGATVWPPVDEEEIEVLGRPARFAKLHRIEDGFAVTFETGGCGENQLIAYGLDEAAVRDFAATLVLRGHADTSNDAFTLWPETKPEEVYGSCLLVAEGSQPFRSDPLETALEFAAEQVQWPDARVDPMGRVYDMEEGYQAFDLVRDGTPDAPNVTVIVREVSADCWSVSSVGSPTQPGEPTAVSVTKRGGRLRVHFGLEAHGLDEAAATIRMPLGDTQMHMTVEEFRSVGEQMEVVVNEWADAPGGFLMLIEDAEGRVIGATGQALPSGDFVAG
jgi:hypothetical protein